MISHNHKVVERGLGLLIEQYKDKPRLAALLTSYLDRIQELEDAIWSVIEGRLIDQAVGVQLDILGKLVGQSRIDLDDEIYRTRIRTRIRANRSLGHPEDLIAVTQTCIGLDIPFEHRELYPATTIIDIEGSLSVASVLHSFLVTAKAIGTAVTTHFFEGDLENTFAFAESDVAEEDTARGFAGDDGDPPGGQLIGAF